MSCREQTATVKRTPRLEAEARKSASGAVLLSCVLSAAIGGCGFKRDEVLAGAYGPEQMFSGSMMVAPVRGQSAGTSARPTAGSAARPPMNGGNTSAGAMAPASGGSNATGMAGTSSAGMEAMQPAAAGTGTGPGMEPAPDAGTTTQEPPVTGGPCDLTGRWLGTVHYVTDALGALQYCHSYLYFEVEQSGPAFTVKKGLQCGDDAVGAGDFAATVDFSGAWAAVATRGIHTGRAGTSEMTADGCQISMDKWYTVRGATLPYYLDPSVPLPTAEEPAMGDTPGWEDWDMDGNPGLTGMISGVVSGKIFTAPRQWTTITGVAPDVTSLIRLPLQWDQEANVMSYDGSPLLASSAVRASDASLHFVQFARLADGEVAGDDVAICASVVELAPTLTPEAAGM